MLRFANHIGGFAGWGKIILADLLTARFPQIELGSYVSGNLEGLMKGQQLADREKAGLLVKTIAGQLKQPKRRLNIIDLCLPDSYFFSRVIKLPPDKKRPDIKEYLDQKADELFPTAAKDLRVRWQLLPPGTDPLVLVVGAETSTLDPLLAVFADNGLQVRQVKPLSFALAAAIAKLGASEFLMQYYHAQFLTTAVYQHHAVLFASCLGVSPAELKSSLLSGELAKAKQFVRSVLPDTNLKQLWLAGFKPEYDTALEDYRPPDTETIVLDDKITLKPKTNHRLDPVLAGLCGLTFSSPEKMNFMAVAGQRQFHRRIFWHNTANSLYLFALALLLPLAVLAFFSLNLFYNQKTEEMLIASAKNSRITQSAREVEQAALRINQKTATVDRLLSQKTTAFAALDKVYNQLPAGVRITAVNYQVDKLTIRLKGTAFSRNDLLALQSNLKKLGAVSVPITSFVKKKDLAFEATVVLSK